MGDPNTPSIAGLLQMMEDGGKVGIGYFDWIGVLNAQRFCALIKWFNGDRVAK